LESHLRLLVFWDVTLRRWISGSRRFEGTRRHQMPEFNVHGSCIFLNFEGEGYTFIGNVWNRLTSDAAAHPKRPKSSITSLSNPQI